MASAEPESEQINPEAESEAYPETEPEAETEGAPEMEGEWWNATAEPEALSEFSDPAVVSMWVTLYSLCMILIIAGDCVVIVCILRDRILRRKEANVYLLSLIVSRTMIGVFVVPVRISGIFSEEYLGSVLCKLCHWSALGSLATSVGSMVAVAVCKYRQTMRRSRHQNDVTSGGGTDVKGNIDRTEEERPLNQAIKVIIIIWLLGHVYAMRVPFLFDLLFIENEAGGTWSCRFVPWYDLENKVFTIVDFICMFGVPLATVLYCYIRVLHQTSRTREHLAKVKVGGHAQRLEEAAGLEKSVTDEVNTCKMLLVVISLFILCNLPVYVIKVYNLWGGGFNSSTLEQISYLTSYSNAWINVIVYIYFRSDIRAALRDLFPSCAVGSVRFQNRKPTCLTIHVQSASTPSLDSIINQGVTSSERL